MGDLSELRGLIVVITFLGVMVLLIGLIPFQFYIAGAMTELDYSQTEWMGIDIQSFQDTWNDTTIYLEFSDFAVGGRNLRIASQYTDNHFSLIQRYGLGLFWLEGGTFFNRKNIKVSYDRIPYAHQLIDWDVLNADYEEYGSVEFTVAYVQNEPFQFKTYFTFNETDYDSPKEAWANDELNLLIGINFDNIATTYNAWDLIAMLLFFRLPDVHWLINVMMATPIWVTVCYLAYVLIIKAIPLLGS